jgi:8-oxo-dGTP diphosphatase
MIIYTLALLEQNSKILFLLRQNSHFFSGYYGLPGGKVDDNESPQNALIREMDEELGIIVTHNDLHFIHCLAFKSEKNDEIIALVFKINHWNNELTNQEPHKCAELAWFAIDNLPENIIPRHRHILKMITQKIAYSENGW